MRMTDSGLNTTAMTTDVPNYRGVTVELIILVIMLTLFSIVGSIGNGLVVFVFQRVREKSTAQVFIISMAVIDLFTCMVIIPLTIFVEYTDFNINYDFVCKFYHFLITSKIPMSALIMVAIAFDRYFCICHPLRRIITVHRAKIIVICLALLSCFFGVITSLFYGVYQVIEIVDYKRIDEIAGTNLTNDAEVIDLQPDRRAEMRERLGSVLASNRLKFNGSVPTIQTIVHTGICGPSIIIFSPTLFLAVTRAYMAVYPICLVFITVLYFMIYRFICLRRSKKLQQKLTMCSYVNGDGTYENTRLVSGDIDESRRNSKNKTTPTADNPGLFPTSISGSNGFTSASSLRYSPDESNANGTLTTPRNMTSDNNFLNDVTINSNLSSSATITTSILTPLDHDDHIPILSFSNSCSSNFRRVASDRAQLVSDRRHSRLPEQKYHWHKNRDSMKRYKGKSKRRKSQYSCDADRLVEENRAANVRTAVMLFTVTIIFMISFVPSWMMGHRILPHISPLFYLYFFYNVANPFIYAFMNQTFKEYMYRVVTCRKLTISDRRRS